MKRYGVSVLAATIAAVMLAVGSLGAQGQAGKTAWGDPDLMGTWSFATLTPLERPDDLAGKEVFSNEEAAQFAENRLRELDADRRDADPEREGVVNGTRVTADVARAYNNFWWDRGTSVAEGNRTSLIVDPDDGRIPALTAAAQQKAAERDAIVARPAHGPEDRPSGERCLHQQRTGPPIQSAGYNNHMQLFQSRDFVAILSEQIHETRFIPLDGRAHLPAAIPQWKGNSRGRWEGDTLVVETTNYNGKAGFGSPTLRLVERFTRKDADTLLYEYTVTDPSTWVKPWSVQLPMAKTTERMYEYACHEGNYGMPSALRGARYVEKNPPATTTSSR
jgi:hypothetical protein